MRRTRQIKSELICGLALEREAWELGFTLVAGVDEVGRGALAGPVVAAAVILDPGRIPEGIDDSKRLSASQREAVFGAICEMALAHTTAALDAPEIDRFNILAATRRAMGQAIAMLSPQPDFVLTDAVKLHDLNSRQRAIIRGDQISKSIAAASIVAKVARDQHMRRLHDLFPEYGWDRNVGYGTPVHLDALRRIGPSPFHRLTFKPVSTPPLFPFR